MGRDGYRWVQMGTDGHTDGYRSVGVEMGTDGHRLVQMGTDWAQRGTRGTGYMYVCPYTANLLAVYTHACTPMLVYSYKHADYSC
jgi:hypothetical protein